MATIVPTVETVGEGALINSIIDRSITELQDTQTTKLAQYALTECAALKKVVFSAVTEVDAQAMRSCTNLSVADFYSPVNFKSNAFYGCSELKALILRASEVCTLAATNVLSSSGINTGSGYIYVPAALVDSYKAAANWSTYANRIRAIEDWPEVCDPYSWEAVAAAINANTYKDIYKIGDMIPVDLGSEGVINMQIAAFDADTLADGSGTAAISWVAKELLATKKPYHNPAANAMWSESNVRTYLRQTVEPLIPSNVRNYIVEVTKITSRDSVDHVSDETVFLPSTREMNYSTAREKTGVVYEELFADEISKKKKIFGEIEYVRYWLRTVSSSSLGFVAYANPNKDSWAGLTADTAYGICLGFCTGRTPT